MKRLLIFTVLCAAVITTTLTLAQNGRKDGDAKKAERPAAGKPAETRPAEPKESPDAVVPKDAAKERNPFEPIHMKSDKGSPDAKSEERNFVLSDVVTLKGIVMSGDRELVILQVRDSSVLFLRRDQKLRLQYEGAPLIEEYTLTSMGLDFAVFADERQVNHTIRIR